MKLLSEQEIEEGLAKLDGWRRDGASIRRTFEFPTFAQGIAFVDKVAELADRMDHHPDIDIRYTRVMLTLTTHSAGGLTKRDFRLAEEIDRIAR